MEKLRSITRRDVEEILSTPELPRGKKKKKRVALRGISPGVDNFPFPSTPGVPIFYIPGGRCFFFVFVPLCIPGERGERETEETDAHAHNERESGPS